MNYLVSGDSLGNFCFWDIKFGTLFKKFNHFKYDVLTMEICEKTQSLYASGVDSNVIHI